MMIKSRYLITISFVLVCILLGSLYYANMTQALRVAPQNQTTIFISVDPVPPFAVNLLGGGVAFGFQILYPKTTLDHTEWQVIDPLGVTVLSGVDGHSMYGGMRIPEDEIEGEYRVHVDYFSVENGLEATSEAVFWVSSNVGNLRVFVFNDLNGNGVKDSNDPFLRNWVVVVRNTKSGIGTYLSTSETVLPYSDFVGLVAGQYEISEAFSVRHVCTTHTVRTTVVAGETNVVFIGVRLLI